MFFVQLKIRVLCLTNIRTLPNWTLNSFFVYRDRPGLSISASFRCRHVGIIFHCKCVILSNLFFRPPKFWQIRAISFILIPPFMNCFALTIIFGWPSWPYRVLGSTWSGALIVRVWHRGVGPSSSGVQESTIRQTCLCSFVDAAPQAECICRMCSFRLQLPNRRRNPGILFEEFS